MLDAIFWGLIQGFFEFLPVSSSGLLVLIPALFGRPPPDLATNAMLHLGTLGAVFAYYRADIVAMAKFDRAARKLITLIVIATIPAATLGLMFGDEIESLISDPQNVAFMLIVTGVILLATTLLRTGDESTENLRPLDAVVVGVSQAFALIPGISRSGMTISAGLARGMAPTEAARFAFLIGIPAIAGAGVLMIIQALAQGESIPASLWVGVVVAGISGYAAIAFLLRLLSGVGLGPFGIACIIFGAIAAFML